MHKRYSYAQSTVATCIAILITTITNASAQMRVMSGSVRNTPIANVAAVVSTDQHGRLLQFKNSAGRTFQVSYDPNGRPNAVLAVGTRNVADMVTIGYDSQGRIAGFALRSGCTVYYDYPSDGTQRIHDRMGGLLVRMPLGDGTYNTLSNIPGAGRLQDFVAALDSLEFKLAASQSAHGS